MKYVSKIDVMGEVVHIKDEEARTATISNKKFIVLGDSYGTFNNSWTARLKTYLKASDNSYYTASEAGAGFVNNGLSGHNFLGLLLTINVQSPELITDIVVGGGANDAAYSMEDLGSAIGAFTLYCKEHYPNAKVSIAHFGKDRVFSYDGIEGSLKAYTRLAGKFGAVYITNSEHILCLSSDWLEGDNLHPSEQGQEKIASYMASGIISGSVDVRTGVVKNTFTRNNSTCTAAVFDSYQSQDNGLIYWEVEGAYNIELAFPNITLPGDCTKAVKIGSLSNDMISGLGGGEGDYIDNAYFNPRVYIPALVETASGWNECTLAFGIKHHDVYMAMFHANPSTHQYETLTGIKHLFASGFSTSVATMKS